MDPDSPYHGMNSIYDADRQRRSWNNGLPHLQPPYQEHPGQPGAHTLPPIQSQRPSFDHGAGLFEQQPRQHPALYSTQANAYPTYASQAPLPSYGQALPHFPVTSSMLASTGPTMPMTQAYANPTTSAFPQIRPMPAPTSAHGLSMSHGYMPSASFGYPNSTDDNDLQPRTHVVGSQGRRGILPSAEGKPSAVTSNGHTVPKSTVIPQKDADGKFPCPHCQKTYLHGKHLKRHLLRHTGDRPYTCFLCQDTFSRSDILKRHFQKCSIRRGNPTGANHLQHSQSHLKKQHARKTQAPSAIDTSFPGGTLAGPHSASPIYNDSGMNVSAGGSGTQSQPDSAKALSDGAPVRDQRGFANSSTNFNRPNFNYMAGHGGSASLPSSGGSTPLTARGTGHFQQTFPGDAGQQRANSFADMNNRPNQSVPSSNFDSHFEWPSYPQGKEGAENHLPQTDSDGVHLKNEVNQPKPEPTDLSDSHQNGFMSGFRGGYLAKAENAPVSG